MTNHERIANILITLNELSDKHIEAEMILRNNPTDLFRTMTHLAAETYPVIWSLQHQIRQLAAELNRNIPTNEAN